MGSSERKAPASQKYMVMLLGLLIGFVIGFVVLLSRLPVDDSLANLKARESFRLPVTREAENYKFYEVLPNQIERAAPVVNFGEPAVASSKPQIRVVQRVEPPAPVPSRAIVPATRPVPANAQNLSGGSYTEVPASFKNNQSYYLQAGNFGSPQSAEAMRARVLMLGLQAFVVQREEPGGNVRHRVRVGPYQARDLLTEAKKRLKRGGIQYEVVRVTG